MSVSRPLTIIHPHTTKILPDTHDHLLTSGTYLANPQFCDNVEWIHDSKAHKLVKKSTPTNGAATDADRDSAPTLPEMAILSVVMVISSKEFWLTPDAGWRGVTKFSKSFADVKPSCTGERPTFEGLSKDFDSAIQNLKWLQDQIVTHGFHTKKGLLVGNPGSP
jgi:hypothetical protein